MNCLDCCIIRRALKRDYLFYKKLVERYPDSFKDEITNIEEAYIEISSKFNFPTNIKADIIMDEQQSIKSPNTSFQQEFEKKGREEVMIGITEKLYNLLNDRFPKDISLSDLKDIDRNLEHVCHMLKED